MATPSDMPSNVNLVIVCACAKIAQFLAPDFSSHDHAMQIPILRVRACRPPSLDDLCRDGGYYDATVCSRRRPVLCFCRFLFLHKKKWTLKGEDSLMAAELFLILY